MKKLLLFLLICASVFLVIGCAQTTTPSDTTDTNGTGDTTEDAGVSNMLPPDPSAVFLDGKKGNDENDALASDRPVKTYEAAFALLSEERNHIVVMSSPMIKSTYSLPKYEGLVVFTSVWDGVDYMVEREAEMKVGDAFSINCDVRFENIKIRANRTSSNICFNYHNATITETVKTHNNQYCTLNLVCGYNVTDVALNKAGHMTAKGVSYSGDCTLTVNSGDWDAVIGGNYRVGYNSPMGTFDGNMVINIGGTASFTSGAHEDDVEGLGVALTGHNITKGKATLNISGGSFDCPIFAVGKVGRYYNFTADNGKNGTDGTQFGRDVRYEADIFVNISGGDFTSSAATTVKALQVPGDTALHGDYTLTVSGGKFGNNFTFSGFGIIGTTTANVTDASKAVCFDVVNETSTQAKEPIRIACCGDSITFGTCATDATVGQYFYKKENYFYPTVLQKLYGTDAVVGNFGYPGSNISTSYNKFLNSCVYASLCEFDPDIIVLALGTNNAANMPSGQSAFLINYRAMIKDMHTRFPNAKIIMTTALYRWDIAERTQMVDQYIIPAQKQLAEEFDYVYLYDANTEYMPYGNTTYYKDKLHPNNLGYQKLAEVMKKGIDALLAQEQ